MDSSATFATGIDLLAQNSSTGFANFGLIQGRDDANSVVMPGSFHYLYVSLTNPTPAGSTPKPSETPILGRAKSPHQRVSGLDH